jgi:roadblock/LC7 domain-containing protein
MKAALEIAESAFDDRELEQKQTLWMLFNTAFAEGGYSTPEKRLITALVDLWKIDPAVAAEMQDTLETMAAMNAYKEWTAKTTKTKKKWWQFKEPPENPENRKWRDLVFTELARNEEELVESMTSLITIDKRSA